MNSLTYSLSSTSVKYEASTQRQIQYKNSTNKPKIKHSTKRNNITTGREKEQYQ